MGNSYIVLGNGFSIDLVQKMNKIDEIDLINLFSKGEHVVYPKTNNRGFLSRKYTPDLWNLGARTYMPYEAAMQLVTDVITCANVYNLSVEKRPNEERDSSNIYIHAYSELSSYLRYLFIYYDSLVSDDDLKCVLDEIELIHYIKNCQLKRKKYTLLLTIMMFFWKDCLRLRIFLSIFMDLEIIEQMWFYLNHMDPLALPLKLRFKNIVHTILEI